MAVDTSTDTMEVSSPINSSIQPSLPSPNGAYIATLTPPRLEIRATADLALIRTIPIAPTTAPFTDRTPLQLRWSPRSTRLLLLNGETDRTRVWDLRDAGWRARIDNGSGGMGKAVYADFANPPSLSAPTDAEEETNEDNADDDDAILLFSDFGARLTVWSLARRGRSVEIRDPKFAAPRGFGVRPSPSHHGRRSATNVFALLSRPGPHDVLTLHAPRSFALLRTVALRTTDAQGLRWSPDGRWLAVWDAPSAGSRVLVLTADGNVFRTYTGGLDEGGVEGEGGLRGLGVRAVEWSPDGRFLAVGGSDGRVTLLGTRTFSPLVHLDHTPTIHLPSTPVWAERLHPLPSSHAAFTRSYALSPQPISPPTPTSTTSDTTSTTTTNNSSPDRAIPTLLFSPTGTHLATSTPAHPTTLWLWDLASHPPRPHAVLLQQSRLRRPTWHPRRDVLAWTCAGADAVYTYAPSHPSSSTDGGGGGKAAYEEVGDPPSVWPVCLPAAARLRSGGAAAEERGLTARWMAPCAAAGLASVLVGDGRAAVVVRLGGRSRDPAFDDGVCHAQNGLGLQQEGVKDADGGVDRAEMEGERESDDESEVDSLFEALTGGGGGGVGGDATYDSDREGGDAEDRGRGKGALLEESGFGFVDEDEDETVMETGMETETGVMGVAEDTFAGRRRWR